MTKKRNFERELRAALRKLSPEQGRVARNNARRGVRKVLKAVADMLDADYPVIPKAKRERRNRSEYERRVRLVRAGWTPLSGLSTDRRVMEIMAVAGVTFKQIEGTVYVPRWAYEIAWHNPKALARAKASVYERKIIMTELALKGDQGG